MRNEIGLCCSLKREIQRTQLVGLKTERSALAAWREPKSDEHADAEPMGVNFVRPLFCRKEMRP